MRRRFAQAAVLYVVFCTTFASNGPSVLYVVYQQRYGFSSLVVTAIFSTYAVAVLATLLAVGRLSDVVGRRPLLLAGALLLVGSSLVFSLASSAPWLFGARALQGVATGTLIAAAGAALVELSAPRWRPYASLANTVAFLGGAAAGSISFGVMVEYLPRPTLLPFIVEIAIDAVAFVAVAVFVTEPVEAARRTRYRFERPSVARPMLGAFVLCSACLGLSWSIGGLYGSLSPTMVRQILHLSSHLVVGAVLCAFNLIGGLTQIASSRRAPRTSMFGGLALIALGACTLEGSFLAHSPPLFFAATVLAGSGGGMAFVGSLSLVNVLCWLIAVPGRSAAFNLVGYLALSVPIIGVGLLTVSIGLRSATFVYSLILVIGSATMSLLLRHSSVGHSAGRDWTEAPVTVAVEVAQPV